MRTPRLTLPIVTLLLWMPPAAGLPRSTGAQAPPPALSALVLHPGDAVRITVWRKPELSGEFVVAGDSSIAHPLYRAVKVAGVPLAVAEGRIREYLARYEADPQLVVEPLLRVIVGGEVHRPNLYTLRPETSIAHAVALAGGATERGRRDRIRVLRDGNEVLVDLTRAGGAWSQAPIRSGDQILVERRRALFRDYIAPVITVAGASAAILNVILRNR